MQPTILNQRQATKARVFTPFFTTIPPERVGLDGNYDHHGLAKRVWAAFEQQVASSELTDLHVKQRGAVVLLMGKVRSRWVLKRLVQIARATYGTVDVETLGVTLLDQESEASTPVLYAHGYLSDLA